MATQRQLPGFVDAVRAYTAGVEALARALLPAYALALQQPPDFFKNHFDKPCWAFRLNHYPPPSELGMGVSLRTQTAICVLSCCRMASRAYRS
jgi:isopenicillin N synthase-like dioxygenase